MNSRSKEIDKNNFETLINSRCDMNKESEVINPEELTEDQLKSLLKKKQAKAYAEQAELKRAYEADNNAFCEETLSKFNELHNELKGLKNVVINDANALYIRMYEVNGKTPKEIKTFSRINTSGNIKITVERQERFEFTEEAVVHINAIKDIFKAKFEGRNKGLYNILDGLLIKGSKGDYDPKLLAKARTQVKALGDEKLVEEFDKLDDCQRITGSSMYCRAYVKDEKGKWKDISLNFSNL